jgi:hypothetical protein
LRSILQENILEKGPRIIEAPRPQGGASRKGNFVHIVPLDPAYKAGLAGHVPANGKVFRITMTVALPTEGRRITERGRGKNAMFYAPSILHRSLLRRTGEMGLLSQYSAICIPHSKLGLSSHSDLF